MSESWNNKDTQDQQERAAEAGPQRENSASAELILSGGGLGKYRILDRIGKTHNAVLYKARDSLLDRLVIVKQISPSLFDDPVACADFRREAQLLARIPKDARNIVNIHELIENEKGLFIILEHVDARSLELLISKRLVDVTDSVRLLKSACLGLRTLHQHGIVHRNITPANLLVGKNGQVRISNLACAAHEGDTTEPPVISARYAAPEQRMGDDYDARIDIYALGMMIYEMCVGRVRVNKLFADVLFDPASAAKKWKLWHTRFQKKLPEASSLNPQVPAALSAILARMTAKSLEERFATVDAVIEALVQQFSIQRANRQQTGANQSMPRVIELWPPANFDMRRSGGNLSALTDTSGLGWPLRQDQSTTRHRVDALAVRPLNRTADQRYAASAADRRSSIQRYAIRRGGTIPVVCIPPKPVKSAIVTGPAEETRHKPRRRRIRRIAAAACFVVACLATTTAIAVWRTGDSDHSNHPIFQANEQAKQIFQKGDYADARRQYRELAQMTLSSPGFSKIKIEAEWMGVVSGGYLALEQDEFAKVGDLIREAEILGARPQMLDELRTRYWAKKDAYRVATEANRALKDGNLTDMERLLDEYAQNARTAGLDPESLKQQIEQTRRDQQYSAALQESRQELEAKNYEAAEMALRDAEVVRITSTTRELRREILDSKKRDDWLLRGDQAMIDEAYPDAETAYGAAMEIKASEDIEKKLLRAGSYALLDQAKEAIKEGELLAAERKLENALWKNPRNQDAIRLRHSMTASFEAARMCEKAGHTLKDGNPTEAIRLLEKALPNLPAPANRPAKQLLTEARDNLSAQKDK